ncbi:flagellar hook-basal body complex protein FliE [Sporomusaceae bacterium FL31]|nr:flagellar hook-basal body complex protein FliE [Sporomusaceae bacterium FL31]GCE32688.1 flagellar hook-basal body complex protein FliE [Sporomusaceae bacterium]
MRIEPLKLLPVNTDNKVDVKENTNLENNNFSQFLSEAIGSVNNLQLQAEKASLDLAAGKVEDVSQVIVATEKASVALQLTMQVRNKVVEAYQEIMRMQV